MGTCITHADDGQRIDHQPGADKRDPYAVHAMAQEALGPSGGEQKGRKESGNEEEGRHSEKVNESKQPRKKEVRLRVLIGPVGVGVNEGEVIDGGVEHQPQQHHDRAKTVQRMIAGESGL